MRKIIIASCLFSLSAFAQGAANIKDNPDIRLICVASDKVVQEHRPDGIYTDSNLPEDYRGKRWRVIKLNELPQHEWIEQLRCSGDVFTADRNFKPEFVVRQEQIKQAQTALDVELSNGYAPN